MEFHLVTAVTHFDPFTQSLLALECCYPHSRSMKNLPEKPRNTQRMSHRWLRRIACCCAAAVCLSFAVAQDSEDIREKTHQIEELTSAGKLREAIPIAEEVLKYCEKRYGPEHSETADSLNDLAFLYSSMNDQTKALPLYQRALKIRETVLGPNHPHTAIILNNLAETYRESGDFAKAEPLYKRAIKIWEAKLGKTHANTVSVTANLALLYQDKDDIAKAEPLYTRVLEIREETLGPNDPDVANT